MSLRDVYISFQPAVIELLNTFNDSAIEFVKEQTNDSLLCLEINGSVLATFRCCAALHVILMKNSHGQRWRWSQMVATDSLIWSS